MNRNDFILPVSMIKVQEKKLLNEDRLIKMLETNSFKEILRILNDTDYSYSIATTIQDDEYEKIINGELERVFKFTREISKNNQEYLCGDFNIGRYAWILEDIIPLVKPIEAKGQLNIWNYEI